MITEDRLAKRIARGKAHFIVMHGVLVWGLVTAVLFISWNLYTKKSLSTSEIVWPFIAFPLGGVLYGAMMWSIMKNRYDKSVGDRH